MDSNKKAQGLPINTIILIAIGLLILVLFITFALGGFNGLGGGAGTTNTALSSFYSTCNTYCSNAQASQSYPSSWCTSTTTVNNQVYHCYSQASPSVNMTTCDISSGSSSGVYGWSGNTAATVHC